MSAGAPKWKVALVWLARIISGGAFVASGWAKTVDPRGFVYKLQEYLAAWHLDGILPTDILAILAVGLALFEFVTGILLITGCLRRSSAICGMLMMFVMLPLTAYIWVADPVQDCGCFGDMLVLSNTVTFLKNIVITAALAVAFIWHKAATPLYRPGLQWLVCVLSGMYALSVSIVGWHLQPVVDFRPYGIGKTLVADEGEDDIRYIYSKDGREELFALDALPDSTWTFVAPERGVRVADSFAIFDGDDDVTEDILAPGDSTKMLLLAVTEPGVDNLVRSRMANEMAEYAVGHGYEMIGVVALSGEALVQWVEMARPEFDVYSASDTSLKQLVRGEVGLVMLCDGRVVWKRNFATVSPDILEEAEPFASVMVVDDGRAACWLSAIFAAGMLLLRGISVLTRLAMRPKRKKNVNEQTATE